MQILNNNGTSTLIALDINIDKDIDYAQATSEEYDTISLPINLSQYDTSSIQIATVEDTSIFYDITYDDIIEHKTEFLLFCNLDNDNISYNIVCTIYTINNEDYCCAFEVQLSEQEQQTFLKNMVVQYACKIS